MPEGSATPRPDLLRLLDFLGAHMWCRRRLRLIGRRGMHMLLLTIVVYAQVIPTILHGVHTN